MPPGRKMPILRKEKFANSQLIAATIWVKHFRQNSVTLSKFKIWT